MYYIHSAYIHFGLALPAGMLNKGVLALNVPLLGARRFMLTKTLEWNLRWGVLDHMLDDSTFCVRPEFMSHPEILEQRLRCAAACTGVALLPAKCISKTPQECAPAGSSYCRCS